MNKLHTLAIATTLSVFSIGAQAADNFAGLTWGKSTVNIDRSSTLKQNMPGANRFDDTIKNSGTWGIRAGQMTDEARYYATYENVSDDYGSSLKLRQQNLIGSYDLFLPVGDTTRLFGGASVGLTKLENESSGYRRDSDIGYLVGLQAGVLQDVGHNTSIEAGYRYLRSNAGTEVAERGVGKVGSIDLHSTKQAYLGVNYKF
ncbi:MAG: outer membrane beta-barrel protein [Gammaproteobacteria bacterium]|uniref:outer membrane protein n=1 Tax=Stutzerimonas xanthomarina TaxID=271420 RepID=UPI00190AB2C8|nr:outer membrane beta-barrel protein [Stutzerimonas xanthomarina]MBU0811310.1 outer membrane beta-barrel protein [Gammaproteobacteria bacterium]MBK3844850.1 outer membrane beta-barrel protein [Stutzerimonas xanthomarina]MBU0852787.1 outer membrane beta-barrel protein [Gammaproteobacteria bacterium]MBU1303020.1 outer membrane beta-barrel protein [Gammaproteobacteria bacterium]MBU1459432.1 outer membrane beta-barrel protein [Gammaproteobacteria bacterium]|tara:strand:- start:5722 stop:6327 length:606 start_codon:yes stop_codon:yes gene_type:complete